MSKDLEDHGLVSVYECENDEEADIIVGLLESYGIEAVLNSEMPHSVLPVNADAHILVNHADAEEARRIIEDAKENGELDIVEED